MNSSTVRLLAISHQILAQRETAASGPSKFCKAKSKERGARDPSLHSIITKEQNMEYLILLGVVAMVALYALIIVGCLKQPEW